MGFCSFVVVPILFFENNNNKSTAARIKSFTLLGLSKTDE
jgi:hypothetical protein